MYQQKKYSLISFTAFFIFLYFHFKQINHFLRNMDSYVLSLYFSCVSYH